MTCINVMILLAIGKNARDDFISNTDHGYIDNDDNNDNGINQDGNDDIGINNGKHAMPRIWQWYQQKYTSDVIKGTARITMTIRYVTTVLKLIIRMIIMIYEHTVRLVVVFWWYHCNYHYHSW